MGPVKGKRENWQEEQQLVEQLMDRQSDEENARSYLSILLTFLILFAIWVVFSGKFDIFHLSLGIICCSLISIISSDLLFSSPVTRLTVRIWFRFFLYIPWLLYQIFLSNLHLLYLVFHPRLNDMLDPRIITFRSKIKDTVGLLTFANSITLTPGTITVYVSVYGDFSVHSIDKTSRDPLPGEMERRIARIFEE